MEVNGRRVVTAGLAVAGLVGALVPAFTADASTGVPPGSEIRIAGSGKCVGVAGVGTVVQRPCPGDTFALVPAGQDRYRLRDAEGCLAVAGGSRDNRAKIVRGACDEADSSAWIVRFVPGRPTVQLVGAGSGRCLNVPGASPADDVQLIQYTCKDAALNDKFVLTPRAG